MLEKYRPVLYLIGIFVTFCAYFSLESYNYNTFTWYNLIGGTYLMLQIIILTMALLAEFVTDISIS